MKYRFGMLLWMGLAAGMLLGCEKNPRKQATSSPATAPVTAAASSGRVQEAPVVLMLGDSITAGYGLTIEQSYPLLLQEKIRQAELPHKIVNAGVTGDTTAGGLERMDWLLRQKVAVLVIALGANDMLRGIGPHSTKPNLQRIIEKGQKAGAKVLLAGMLATRNLGPQYTEQFDAIYPALAKQYRVPLMSFLLEDVAFRPHLNQTDGLHPNAKGAARIADNMWPLLEPLLQKTKP